PCEEIQVPLPLKRTPTSLNVVSPMASVALTYSKSRRNSPRGLRSPPFSGGFAFSGGLPGPGPKPPPPNGPPRLLGCIFCQSSARIVRCTVQVLSRPNTPAALSLDGLSSAFAARGEVPQSNGTRIRTSDRRDMS